MIFFILHQDVVIKQLEKYWNETGIYENALFFVLVIMGKLVTCSGFV